MQKLQIELKGETVSKKNSRQTLRNGRNIPSKQYLAWHDDSVIQVRKQLMLLAKNTFYDGTDEATSMNDGANSNTVAGDGMAGNTRSVLEDGMTNGINTKSVLENTPVVKGNARTLLAQNGKDKAFSRTVLENGAATTHKQKAILENGLNSGTVLENGAATTHKQKAILENGLNSGTIPALTLELYPFTGYTPTDLSFYPSESLPIAKPCKVSIDFYHGDKRRRDSDNGTSSILDLLVDCGILQDDKWEIVQSLEINNFYDKNNSRSIITIQLI